jgi:hypothetical protein
MSWWKRVKPEEKPQQYHVREIDYLAYNTLFSIQQLLNTLNELKDNQKLTIKILSRIESRMIKWENEDGKEGNKDGQEKVNPRPDY